MGSGRRSTSTSSAGAAGNGAMMMMMMAGVTLKAISIVLGAGGITGGGSDGFIRGLNYMVADEAIRPYQTRHYFPDNTIFLNF